MEASKRLTLTYGETYKKKSYVPSKEDIIKLIKKEQVSLYISKRSKYSDGKEILTLEIVHA